MARRIEEIFSEMLRIKESQPGLSELKSGSATAIWRLWLYVVSVGLYVVENLIDAHKSEVDAELAAKTPHTARWYRNKSLAFMRDRSLVADMDYYDISNMSEEDIKKSLIVKYAAAAEDKLSSMLTIKIAGEDENKKRAPLSEEEARQFAAYISEIKDAGVKINIVNIPADKYACSVDVYYNPMREAAHVQEACNAAIKNYIENLPFNGEYTNMALVDVLQGIDGVKIAELKSAVTGGHDTEARAPIDARCVPIAGYFTAENITLNMVAYE